MRLFIGLIFLTVLILAGCATKYQAPTSGSTAMLRIISKKPNDNFVSISEKEGCIVDEWKAKGIATLGVNANSIRNAGTGFKVGVPFGNDELPKQTTEILIPAGNPISILGNAVTITGFLPFPPWFLYTFCRSGVSFNPLPNEAYEVIFDQTSASECSSSVFAFKKNTDSEWTRTTVGGAIELKTICKNE